MVPEPISDVVIVGGGVAAHRCAFRLRELGYERRIAVLAAEPVPPYDRTALSKAGLDRGGAALAELSSAAAYDAAEIELALGRRVARISPGSRTILCRDGSEHRYDRALIATGARPVLPPQLRAPGVCTLRQAADLPALLAATGSAQRIAIVGGGLIGCELASRFAGEDRLVTMIEAAPAPLHQVTGAEVALRVLELHRRSGVEVLTKATVGAIGRAGRRFELRLDDGTSLLGDCVVVAIGARPHCAWLAESGLAVDDGVVTDEYCETTLPGVFAAGDCARFPSRRLGRAIRLEHWDSAARHGSAAAENMLGGRRPFDPIPFFWSDQQGKKLAMAGLPGGDERPAVEADADSLLVTFSGPAGPTAGVGLDRTKQVVELRRRLEGERR